MTATREQVEVTALRVLHQRGFDQVSVDELATTAGISRATFFRYFGTKAGVVWWRFDEAIDVLERELAVPGESDRLLDHIEEAIVRSIQTITQDDEGIWWDRFALFDTEPALQGDAAARWRRWTAALEKVLAASGAWGSDVPVPAIVASAYQGAYLGVLRSLPPTDRLPHRLEAHMREAFAWIAARVTEERLS
ncbi:TetR family transcriptional regulator (plasmid) [Rhodococcus pyridinivorans]|uniref:TetR family transcriptional regulator n=1 Tax=Rhodococcus pyridinivorans TaxID=103816 RepID=UPI001FFFF3A9|nr:TetR family transcriptional regulator [Rhodococcus pyridinivorans]UPK66400.1 TetR family transcriptional regulator [Rhodococcus pyridinivorans]